MARNGFRTAQYGKVRIRKKGEFYILPVVERSRRDNPDRDAVAYGEIGFKFAFLSVGEIVALRRKLNFTPKCARFHEFLELHVLGQRAGQARVKRAGTARESSSKFGGDALISSDGSIKERRRLHSSAAMRSLFPLLVVSVLLPYSLAYRVGEGVGFENAASFLKDAVDKSVDPCEDFYNFTCGGWEVNRKLTPGRTKDSWMWLNGDVVIKQFRALLEDPTRYGSRAMNMMKTIYRKCLDSDVLARSKNAELRAKIDDFGGFPVILGSQWDEANFDFTKLLADVAYAESEVLFCTMAEQDERNVTKQMLNIKGKCSYVMFETHDATYVKPDNSKEMEAIRKFMVHKITLLKGDNLKEGEEIDHEMIKKDVEDMLQFEIKLAVAYNSVDKSKNSVMKLSNVTTLLPQLNWLAFFQAQAPQSVHAHLNSDPEVVVEAPEMLKKTSEILETVPKRTVANYVMWKYFKSWIMKKQLDERYDQVDLDYTAIGMNRFPQRSRPDNCVAVVNHRNFLKHVGSAIYVREYFPAASKAALSKMVDGLPSNSATRTWRWTTRCSTNYKDVVVKEDDSYPEMIQRVQQWDMKRKFEKILEPTDFEDFRIQRAFRQRRLHPVQKPSFVPRWIPDPTRLRPQIPGYMNYGGAGHVIGHEMTHGFDTKGALHDKFGNKANWWDAETKKQFEERSECMKKQYSGYEVPKTGKFVNGESTISENIADNGAVKETFRAYQKYLEENGEEPRIPGFEEYTNEQMFFIAFGHFYCNKMTMQQTLNEVGAAHTPDALRSIGPLRNSPEFAKTFNCPAGSYMNPPDDERCHVW
ncbi:hypothetical protein L596_027267 [Steinernema carpocapsae]|uniref:Peptidase M13 C-terminal domain-containing protein n=2 Tax=Steinernema carpocapsae TaxID=34508 RepID=A0A4U5M3S8_STECR|nr:hypothetical protein L596_027267 [Steinernema carpocapsae]